jgi:hypothetical protein
MNHLVVTLKMTMSKNDHKAQKPRSVARWAESQLRVAIKERGKENNHRLLLISVTFRPSKASLQ